MISIVLGTRPEIIKMMPLVKECERRGLEFEIVHSGQHYSFDMDSLFFSQLGLPEADHKLEVGSGRHGEQSARILERCEGVFARSSPSVVLVQGDTNTVMAASLAASKMNIPVGHVEAGLRSYDRSMPEELNRIVSDHLSRFLFAPTSVSKKNLEAEGISENVHVTGNTIVDAVLRIREVADVDSVLSQLGLKKGGFVLATAHRAENVDSEQRLRRIVEGLNAVSDALSMPVVLPMHPRTAKMLDAYHIDKGSIVATDPLGVLQFVALESSAALCMTDSGGVQEEACILGTPCVTMRDNTERPETVDVGANVLVGADVEKMVAEAGRMVDAAAWENPFGDGGSAQRIIGILEKEVD